MVLGWEWRKLYAPPNVLRQKNNLTTIQSVSLIEEQRGMDLSKLRGHPVVFITGDGRCLPDDVAEFESWGIPHDLYCVNRSMLFFQRQVDHWAAIDIEESVWFSENVTKLVEPERRITRHTIGHGSFAYDVYWEMDIEYDNEFVRRVLVGNTGYFAILTCVAMGYEKIIIGGMPLNMDSCWYEPEDAEGPNWMGWTFVQWMDFKMQSPHADKVRSMQGYTEFILGKADKEWVNAV